MAATIAMTDEPVALDEAPFLSLFLLSFWLGLFGLVSPGLFWSPGLFGVTATLVNSTVDALADGIAVQHGLHRVLADLRGHDVQRSHAGGIGLDGGVSANGRDAFGQFKRHLGIGQRIAERILDRCLHRADGLAVGHGRTVDRGQRGLLGIRLGGVGDRALGQFVGGRNLHRIGLVAAVILDLHPQFMTGGGWTWCMRQVWYDHG